jgi:hypothetical protein
MAQGVGPKFCGNPSTTKKKERKVKESNIINSKIEIGVN